jgi:hypothetical protein
VRGVVSQSSMHHLLQASVSLVHEHQELCLQAKSSGSFDGLTGEEHPVASCGPAAAVDL